MENIIAASGGCGLHQLITCLVVHLSRLPASWSTIGMAFIGLNPGFYCKTMTVSKNTLGALSLENMSSVGLCSLDENSKCVSYQFLGEMSTAVSEWSLVCEKNWTVGLLTSLQMVSIVCGCIGFGYLSDAYGRKPTFFTGLILLVTFNLIGCFAQSLQMYVVLRIIIGLGSAATTTTMFLLMVEFLPIKWRSIVSAVPSGSLSEAIFAFVCWQLHDWRKVHLVTAAVGAPLLLTYWFLPESARWLVTKGKFGQARKTVNFIAIVNGRERPDLNEMFETSVSDTDKKLSIVDLFKATHIRKVTLCLSVACFTLGFGYYGLVFGVNDMYGNPYLNLFLVTVIDVPFAMPTGILLNRFGRRKCCFVIISLSGVFVTGAGILKYSGFLGDTHVTTVLVLLATLTCNSATTGIRIYTLELYSTLVRATGYGFQNTLYRLGGAVAPQVLTLNDDIAGIFYFTTGILMILSAIATFFLPETADKSLEDCPYSSE